MRESASAKAARLQHAMRRLARMPDGAQPWAITGIATYVAEGMTFEEAERQEQRDHGYRAAQDEQEGDPDDEVVRLEPEMEDLSPSASVTDWLRARRATSRGGEQRG